MVNAITTVSDYIKAHPCRAALRNLFGRPYGHSEEEKALFKLLTLLYCACETEVEIDNLTNELIVKCYLETEEAVIKNIWQRLNQAKLADYQHRQGKKQLNHFIRAYYQSSKREPAILIINPNKCLNHNEISKLNVDESAGDYYLFRFTNDQEIINKKIRAYDSCYAVAS